MTFVTCETKLSNPQQPKSELRTAEGNASFTSHSGKTKLMLKGNNVHIPALVALNFQEDIISVAQLEIRNNVLFTKYYCYLIGANTMPNDAIIIVQMP